MSCTSNDIASSRACSVCGPTELYITLWCGPLISIIPVVDARAGLRRRAQRPETGDFFGGLSKLSSICATSIVTNPTHLYKQVSSEFVISIIYYYYYYVFSEPAS